MYVCTWFNQKINRIKIENIKPDEKVLDFKNIALNSLEEKFDNLEFTYRGCVLKDEKTLADYEINENSEIFVIERICTKPCTITSSVSNEDVQNTTTTFHFLTQLPGFRSNVQRIIRSGFLNDLHKLVPDILSDYKSISMLSDPELLIHLSSIQTTQTLSEKHPALIKAALILGKHLSEQNNLVHNQPTTSTGYSYSLDALSEDDDMDLSTESRGSSSLSRNSSYNAITSAQLAAAIANATNSSFTSSNLEMPSTPIGAATPNIITNEMFSNALQQAFGITPTATPPVTPVDSDESLGNTYATRYEEELRHMHELGLVNDIANIRALQASSGNLQEAIELLLSGALD